MIEALVMLAGATAAANDEPARTSRWFVRAGVIRAMYNSSAKIAIGGAALRDASAGVTDSNTVTFDAGYDVSDRVAVMFMVGVPPRASVPGQGSVAAFGKLGSVLFGPAVLTAVYRLPEWHGFRPYFGGGGEHLFILNEFDGAVKHLRANDAWGSAVQVGVEHRLNRKWEVYADYKHLWLSVDAKGQLGGQPVKASVKLNPDVISVGVKLNLG
jgi:outer membrane protein